MQLHSRANTTILTNTIGSGYKVHCRSGLDSTDHCAPFVSVLDVLQATLRADFAVIGNQLFSNLFMCNTFCTLIHMLSPPDNRGLLPTFENLKRPAV